MRKKGGDVCAAPHSFVQESWGLKYQSLLPSLFLPTGFLSLIMHLLYLARRIEWQNTETSMEEGIPEPAAGDNAAVGLSVSLPLEEPPSPVRNRLPSASICFNKTVLRV